MLSGVSGLGTLGFVLLGVGWMEFRARRVASVDEVVHGLGMQVVGALPALPGRVWPSPFRAVPHSWHSLMIEAVDATRTILMHAAQRESIRTVMVTSAVGGEGKTALSCHLATSLARAGRRTLLIDCDLRNPSVHGLFDIPPGPGLSEWLRGEAVIDEVIRTSPAGELWVIPAGQGDSRAIQALAREEIGELIGQLKERFDFVVIDTSPVLPVVDALLIGKHADVAICSILRDVSRIPKVYAASVRLAALGIRLLGAVVLGVRSDVYDASTGKRRDFRDETNRRALTRGTS